MCSEFITTYSKFHNIFQIQTTKHLLKKYYICTKSLQLAWWVTVNYQVIQHLHRCVCFPVNNNTVASCLTDLRSFQCQYHVTFPLLWLFKVRFAVSFLCGYILYSLWDLSGAKCYRRILLLCVFVMHTLVESQTSNQIRNPVGALPGARRLGAGSLTSSNAQVLLVSSSHCYGGRAIFNCSDYSSQGGNKPPRWRTCGLPKPVSHDGSLQEATAHKPVTTDIMLFSLLAAPL